MTPDQSPTMIDSDADGLQHELEKTRARLAAVEWALERLSQGDGDIEGRISEMLEAAIKKVEEAWAEGRRKAESLVHDAQELKMIAEKSAAVAEAHAREKVAVEVHDLLENARTLQRTAEEKALRTIAEAEQRALAGEKTTLERLGPLQEKVDRIERQIASREAILDEVRKKADQIIRNAKTTAETIRAEAMAAAKRNADVSGLEAARIIQAAKDEARQQLARVTAQERDAKERLANARSQYSDQR